MVEGLVIVELLPLPNVHVKLLALVDVFVKFTAKGGQVAKVSLAVNPILIPPTVI